MLGRGVGRDPVPVEFDKKKLGITGALVVLCVWFLFVFLFSALVFCFLFCFLFSSLIYFIFAGRSFLFICLFVNGNVLSRERP